MGKPAYEGNQEKTQSTATTNEEINPRRPSAVCAHFPRFSLSTIVVVARRFRRRSSPHHVIASTLAAHFLKSTCPDTGSKARWVVPLASHLFFFGSAESATERFHGLNKKPFGTVFARRFDNRIEADGNACLEAAPPRGNLHPLAVFDTEL